MSSNRNSQNEKNRNAAANNSSNSGTSKSNKRSKFNDRVPDFIKNQGDNRRKYDARNQLIANSGLGVTGKSITYFANDANYVANSARNYWHLFFNHPEWYLKGSNAEALPAGMDYRINKIAPVVDESLIPNVSTGFCVPSALEFRLIPGTYSSFDKENGFEPAAHRFFAELVTNSGRIPKYSADEAIAYIFNVAQFGAILAQTIRAFLLSHQSSAVDASIPEIFEKAGGFSVHSFTSQAANIRDELKILCNQFYTTFPVVGALNDRWRWLFGNLFVDYNGPKATFIMPSISTVAIQDGKGTVVDFTTDNAAKPFFLGLDFGTPTTWETIRGILYAYKKQLVDWYSESQMLSDMQRVFGFGESSKLLEAVLAVLNQPTPTIEVVEDPYMLRQLQNAEFPMSIIRKNGSMRRTTYGIVYGNISRDLRVFCTPDVHMRATCREYANMSGSYVNGSGSDLSSVGEQLSLTRLKAAYDMSNNEEYIFTTTYGTEIPLLARVHEIQWNSARTIMSYNRFDFGTYTALFGDWYDDQNGKVITLNDAMNTMTLVSLVNSIDFHPIMRLVVASYNNDGGAVTNGVELAAWDWDLYAKINSSQLQSQHATCVYSLYFTNPIELNKQHLIGYPSV